MNTEELRIKLVQEKGNWRRIARESTIPYDTLTKFALRRVTHPRSDTMDKLTKYFEEAA